MEEVEVVPPPIDHEDRFHSRSPSPSPPPARSPSPSQYACCKDCTKTARANKRSCICQVPSSRRRAALGEEGCITCKCIGCHPEDISKREKGETSFTFGKENSFNYGRNRSSGRERFNEHLKNGCCRECMRAFSSTRRACICQVPSTVREANLPHDGCRICGCRGCHPEDKKGGSSYAPTRFRDSRFIRDRDPYPNRDYDRRADVYTPYYRDRSYRDSGRRDESRDDHRERSRGRSRERS